MLEQIKYVFHFFPILSVLKISVWVCEKTENMKEEGSKIENFNVQ